MLFDQITSIKGEPGFSFAFHTLGLIGAAVGYLWLAPLSWWRHPCFDYWWDLCLYMIFSINGSL